jgi:hypothetical protein
MARGFIEGEYQDGELRGLTFIAGQRNMGKTTETTRLLNQCAGGAVFFDTTGNHGGVLRGYKTFSQPGPLKEYLRLNHGRRFRIRYEPRDEHAHEHFEAVCLIVRAVGWMIFAVDEVDTFCGPEHGVRQMPAALYNLAHFGRHYRVSMIVTARDPASLSIRFRSQCETFRIFRTDEERYVQYFSGRIGKVNAARLSSLTRFQFLLWRSGSSDAVVQGGRRNL